MSAGRFRLDGEAVDAETFRQAAIDPARSVVVDACAGSGKTTLLVARIVRALLEGAEPDQVLAVTFTRLAAHEMHERLVTELRALAVGDDAWLHGRLSRDLGLGPARAEALAERARGLYEAVLRHPRGPEITTFHRWFRTLAAMGPLSTDTGEGSQLTEEAASLQQQAWFAWLDALRDPIRLERREDFERLVAAVGLSGTRRCLASLIAQRTDWAVALGVDPDGSPDTLQAAAERAGAAYFRQWREAAGVLLGGAAPDGADALLAGLAVDATLRDAVAFFAPLLAGGGVEMQRQSVRLAAVAGAPSADGEATRFWLTELAAVALTAAGSPRKWRPVKAMAPAIDAAGGADAVAARWEAFAERVATARSLVDEGRGVALNASMMRCGADLLGMLRELKRAQGVIDFADLESIAYRMLRDPGVAAYLQCRMDRRYRHLLFDEFQDTSSLQWRVIADWLQSYAGAGGRPSVFVVGDPKQSIYRFRRAEARVFEAARELLRESFDARETGTDTTRRNAPAIVAVLNRCLPASMPHYREQATLADACEGLFWRLPLAVAPAVDEVTENRDVAFDWLRDEREDDASLRHVEGIRIARAIALARTELARQGRPVAFGSIYVLARSRTGFEAYERALREHGMPVQSDRAGGLLQTLEGDDLRALLAFVRRPSDDLALAQVLASPLIGLDGDALDWIAARGPLVGPDASAPPTMPEGEAHDEHDEHGDERPVEPAVPAVTARRWWPRLRALAAEPPEPPFDVRAVVARLAAWIDAAARLPVHDFLDAVLAEVDAFAGYPAVVEPSQRAVVHANLLAMLGLALDVDAGRFPSLARFLRRLRGFDTLDDREGPSEGRSDAVDAIRLMTIHASKGLEADLVVLADAHQRPRADGQRLHVDWPPELEKPSELSFVFDAALAGRSRQASFERDLALRDMEDQNLLYVALTRARHGVIVSGVAGRTPPTASWYTVLNGVDTPPDWLASEVGQLPEGAEAGQAAASFELRMLDLPRLGVGARRDPGVADGGAPGTALAIELGHAMHRALELLPAGHGEASVLAALHAFALDDAQRRAALARARRVMALPALAPAFDPAARSVCEYEILDLAGEASRIDRLVRVGGETWVIDYKWSVGDDRIADYRAQLAGYRALVGQLAPGPFGATGTVRTVLVDATAGQVSFDVDLA